MNISSQPGRLLCNSGYNFLMCLRSLAGVLLLLGSAARAQQKPVAASPKSVVVPAIIDHNRIVLDAEIPLPDGSAKHVRAWVDNGNPDLEMSRRLAMVLGLAVSCNDQECSSPPPLGIVLGGMTIPFTGVKQAKIPLKPVSAAAVLASGMNVAINIPSTVLRHFDVAIDFPGRKFSIGTPGTIRFQGSSGKVMINPENGLIQVPSRLEGQKQNLALDLGASIGFLSQQLFEPLATAHPDWPHMTGAVGPANVWGGYDEPSWKVMRLERLQFGPLFLTSVAMVDFPKDRMEYFEKRAGISTVGMVGANVFQNYRVGLDYAHSLVYFDIGRLFLFPDFNVIGITLKPQDDGKFTILAAYDSGNEQARQASEGVQKGDILLAVDGIPVQGSTMGQVWSMLGGTPGQERKLTISRSGKELVVTAKVQAFLAEGPEKESGRKR